MSSRGDVRPSGRQANVKVLFPCCAMFLFVLVSAAVTTGATAGALYIYHAVNKDAFQEWRDHVRELNALTTQLFLYVQQTATGTSAPGGGGSGGLPLDFIQIINGTHIVIETFEPSVTI